MATRIGINGFGRIGRLTLRALLQHHNGQLEVAAINDLTDTGTNAHLLKYDSVHGPFPGRVRATKTGINFGRGTVPVFAQRDPANLPWGKLKVDVALECTGIFTKREAAGKHLEAGAKRVLIFVANSLASAGKTPAYSCEALTWKVSQACILPVS